MQFVEICTFLDSVKQLRTAAEKAKKFQTFFAKCRQELNKDTIFPVLRLLVPKQDRERQSYHMQESIIARVLIKMLSLPPGRDKDVLTKSYLMAGRASDFGDVVYSVVRNYITNTKATLSVPEFNAALDSIANRKNEVEAEEVLLDLFRKCPAENYGWIIRILLKSLKVGMDDNRILNCYHRDGASYFSSNVNLRKTAEVLFDEKVNLHELGIEVFEAFRPMLSKRVDATVFKKYFKDNRNFFVENKFDGERFQLHMADGKFKYFSRNGFDYTSTFGDSFENPLGIFTPKLKNIFHPDIKSIILDGEMMLWNKSTQKYGSKGMELDVKKLKAMGKYQPCFCVYDIILLNDEILTNRPLKQRVKLLKSQVFQQTLEGTIVLSQVKKVFSPQEIVDELNLAVDKQDEGIIVKDPDSVYKYSDRNSGWFKMKLEYFQDTMNDMDLVLMGGQFASSTSDQLNSFIVGVQSGRTTEGQPIFISLGKVSSGLNDDQLDLLNDRLKTKGKPYDNRHGPDLVFGKEIPNYYIQPKDTIVFTIRATELVRSNDSYKTSYTLRFPRVLAVRQDKPPEDCLSINDLLELTAKNKTVIKLNKRNITLEEIMQTKTRQVKKKPIEMVNFVDTTKVSDFLEEYVFFVFNGNVERPKDKVEGLIRRAGGEVFYKADDKVDIVLVVNYNEQAKQFCSKRQHFDVVNVAWLDRVVKQGELLGYEPLDVYCLGTSIKNCLSSDLDRYADSYTVPATVDTLKHSFSIMTNLKEEPNFTPFIKIPGKNFEDYTAYFDKYLIVNNLNSEVIYQSLADELEFRYYFGTVCESIGPKTNLIITNGDKTRKIVLCSYLQEVGLDNVIDIKDSIFIYTEPNTYQ